MNRAGGGRSAAASEQAVREARSGRVRQAESPYRMVGCVTARVAWADPWALATGVVREG